MLEILARRQRMLIGLTLAMMVGLLIADVLIPTGYDRLPWEGVPAFGALLGIVSALVAIALASLLGHLLLHREEDYFDE